MEKHFLKFFFTREKSSKKCFDLFKQMPLVKLFFSNPNPLFSYTFGKLVDKTDVIWKYQQYELIEEYYRHSAIVAPFSFILFFWSLLCSVCKFCDNKESKEGTAFGKLLNYFLCCDTKSLVELKLHFLTNCVRLNLIVFVCGFSSINFLYILSLSLRSEAVFVYWLRRTCFLHQQHVYFSRLRKNNTKSK